jgi:hypothetical protein
VSRCIALIGHSAELKEREGLLAAAWAHLAKDYGRSQLDLYEQCNNKEYRR